MFSGVFLLIVAAGRALPAPQSDSTTVLASTPPKCPSGWTTADRGFSNGGSFTKLYKSSVAEAAEACLSTHGLDGHCAGFKYQPTTGLLYLYHGHVNNGNLDWHGNPLEGTTTEDGFIGCTQAPSPPPSPPPPSPSPPPPSPPPFTCPPGFYKSAKELVAVGTPGSTASKADSMAAASVACKDAGTCVAFEYDFATGNLVIYHGEVELGSDDVRPEDSQVKCVFDTSPPPPSPPPPPPPPVNSTCPPGFLMSEYDLVPTKDGSEKTLNSGILAGDWCRGSCNCVGFEFEASSGLTRAYEGHVISGSPQAPGWMSCHKPCPPRFSETSKELVKRVEGASYTLTEAGNRVEANAACAHALNCIAYEYQASMKQLWLFYSGKIGELEYSSNALPEGTVGCIINREINATKGSPK